MSLWGRFFKKEEHKEKVDSLKNIQIILEFLNETNADVKELISQFSKLEDLEKEKMVAKKNLLEINLKNQAHVFDKILASYEFFQNDVDVNGLRLKKIAAQFLKSAEEAGLSELVIEKKKNSRWQFYW